jgi:hypothetical protein
VPERPSVTQSVQLGVEAVPGDGAPADILVRSFTIEPGPAVDMQRFRPTGSKFESIIVPGKEWVEADLSGLGSYQELQYLLSGILAKANPTQPAAVTGGQVWSYELKAREPDDVQTYSFEQGDSNFAHKFSYGLFTELGIGLSRDGVEISGSLIAHALEGGATLTADPVTVDPDVPILPTEIDVFYNTSFATLGTTKLGRAFQANITIGDRFNPIWVLNSAAPSYDGHVETAPTIEVELLVAADDQGMALLDIMRAGEVGYLRVAATSPVLAGTTAHKFTFDMAGKVADVSDFSDEDGVYAVTWTLAATLDPDLGVTATLRNLQPSLDVTS